MNREEASFILANIDRRVCDDELNEALDMAIKALEQEPCGNAIDRAEAIKIASGYCHPTNVAKELAKLPPVNPQPSGNAIDRKLVCAFIDGLISDDGEREKGLEYIRSMPPVNPTKTGHWEQYGNSWEDKFKCSECGKEQPKILCGEQIIGHWSDYCPNCGCRMVEPQESEE